MLVLDEVWEAWPDQATSLTHIGDKVEVRSVDSDKPLLTGYVVDYTDLLGSGGILQPHPELGMNFVAAAIRFPQDPKEYAKEMGSYLFRVLEK